MGRSREHREGDGPIARHHRPGPAGEAPADGTGDRAGLTAPAAASVELKLLAVAEWVIAVLGFVGATAATIVVERLNAPTWLLVTVASVSYALAGALIVRHRIVSEFRSVVRRFRTGPVFPTIILKQLSDYPQISLIDARQGGQIGLQIHSAEYGHDAGVLDVQSLLEEAITRHGLDIVVNNTTMRADPAPGAPKELVVDYSLDHQRRAVRRLEHQRLRIAGGVDVPTVVSSASVGR
jgi:hypothetical protein